MTRTVPAPLSTADQALPLGSRAVSGSTLPLGLEEIANPTAARVVVAGTTALVVLFGLWAAATHLPELAVAQGAVVTLDPVAPVQHLEGGIIDRVLVADGALVAAGQPLVVFASATAQAELDQFRAREASLRFQAARLRALLDDGVLVVEDGDFPGLADDQRAELEGRLRARLDRQTVLREQVAQREAEGAALSAQLAGLRRQHDLQANELALRERLLEQGLTTRVAVLEIRRAVLGAAAEIARLDAALAGNARAVAEAQARLAEAASTARDETAREASRVNLELAEVGETVRRAFERVGRLTVLAPADGTVKGLAARTPGQVVPPGGTLMEIVPHAGPLAVEARLSPRDVGFTRIGQPVTVKVHSFDYARYGTVDGTLVQISATTTPDEQGQPFYTGRVALAAQHVGHDTAAHRLLPGMTVQADIVTGGKSLLQYLLKPVHASMSESFRER
jgi:HlyD family type I secretion membrane fusion protein